MDFDLAASLRRLKPQKRRGQLVARVDGDLTFVGSEDVGSELMLDTVVYIDLLQSRAPTEVKNLIRNRIINHSVVALSELTHPFGRLDPANPLTRRALKGVSTAVEMVVAHRLSTPSPGAFGEAGIVAGLLARLTGRAHGQELLNDAVLLLHATETGRVLLTRNIADFDLLQQLVPRSRILLYRGAPRQGVGP